MSYSTTVEFIVHLQAVSFRYLLSRGIPLLEIRQRTTRQNVLMSQFCLFHSICWWVLCWFGFFFLVGLRGKGM